VREKSRVSVRVGLVANLVGLALVNTWLLWQPWTHGLVTGEFSRVVLAADLAIGVQIVGDGLLLRTADPATYRRIAAAADVASRATGLASLAMFLRVYPLALGDADGPLRVALGVATFGVVVALVVALLRAAEVALEAAEPAEHAPPVEPEPEAKKRPTPQRPPPPRSRRHR
jgi:hypothetical protein